MRRRTLAFRAALLLAPLAQLTDCCHLPAAFAAEPAAAPQTTEESAEEKKERVTAERFLMLLKRRPRTGTALDKVYGYYVARGELPEFCEQLEEQARAENDGGAWTILGMVQQQRGNDTQAAEAFRQAEQLLPEQPLPSYYLGKTLVLLGEVDGAADAMRRAIEKKPARADMLAIFQDLGRIFQRTGKNEEALQVWSDLEALFPNDPQVQEEIARILADEGATEDAAARYDALAKSTKDRFRQVEMALRAAQLRAKLGRTEQALREFEGLLGRVNPDSWLHRDIRRRIEEVFWSSGDVDGLTDYYTNWVEEHPDDVDAMMRAARFLAVQRRLPEAKEWFRKAIEKAPSRAEPRQALVDALVSSGEVAAAAKEMEELADVEPGNPDYLVRWGELVLADAERPEDKRRAEAAEIWKRMLAGSADDPVTVARVADLLRSAEATDQAIAQYERAIELAPDEPQYREYLGEFLHQLDRKDEAVEVWRQLAEGDRRTRDNLVRLCEVYSTFKHAEKALEAIAAACEMNPGFAERARYAELLREAGQHDDALGQLDLAEPLAEDPELREVVILERIKNYQASGSLEDRISDTMEAVSGAESDDAETWRVLALLHEADRKFQPACEAAEKAAELAPGDPVMWETAATLQERSGKFGDAIRSYRRLASIDRRFLSSYLTQIASLEMRLGNADAALEAGEELLSSAPGNAEHARFFADLCFRLGEEDRGLDVLRRAVRSAPNSDDTLTYLAQKLSEAFRTDEAIELYWRAFDLAMGLDGQTAVIGPLTELYLRTNRFDSLTDRLELTGREANKPRQASLWVAAAHQAAGDLGAARQILEQLAREESRDTNLLKQLVTLSRAEYDHESAAEYQRRLVAVAPTPEAEYLLANILLDLGEIDQSEALWLKLAQRKNDPSSMMSAISTLVGKEQYETAERLIEKGLASNPQDWELLAQAIVVQLKLGNGDSARAAADQLLALDLPSGQPTQKTKQRIEQMQRRQDQTASRMYARQQLEQLGRPSRLVQVASQIKAAISPDDNNPYRYSYSQGGRSYEPSCFQDAQALALCVPLAIGQEEGREEFDEAAFVNSIADDALEDGGVEELWRALFYLTWQDPQAQYNEVANKRYEKCLAGLVKQQDPYAAQVRLTQFVNRRNRSANGDRMSLEPLPEEQLEQLEEWSRMASDATRGAFNYYQMLVASEFSLAGKQEKADDLINGYLEAAAESAQQNPYVYLQAMSVLLNERYNNGEPSEKSLQRVRELFKQGLANSKLTAGGQSGYAQSYYLLIEQIVKHGSLDDAFACMDAMLHWQAEGTAKLRPSQRDRINTGSGPLNFGRSVNGRYMQTTIGFPPLSSYFGSEAIYMTHALHTATAEKPELRQRAAAKLEEWAASETDDAYLRLARLLAKASFEYWSDDKADARRTLASASDLSMGAQFVNLARTRMLYESGDARGALRVAEQLRPSNQQMLVDKELAILQLVLQIGDLDRAKKSAQRLFALRLKSDVEFKLADLMYQLGMRDLGDRMMGRIRRRAGSKQDTLVQLMTRYATAGDDEQAAEIARQVVRRTSPRTSRNRYTSENRQHEQAVQVLARTKQLAPLIEQYEQRLERSPKSMKLVNQLASFYEAAGRRDDALKLRVESAENAPQDPRNLYAAAERLAQAGNHAEAVEKYVAAVIKSPDLLNQNYYEMQDSFESAKAWPKLTDGIIKAGIAKFQQSSYRFSEIIRELSEAKQHDAINRLLYAAIDELPMQQANQMFYSIARSDLKPDEKVAELLAEKLTDEDIKIDVNSSNAYVWSRSSDGRCTGGINGVAQIVASRDDLKDRIAENMRGRLEKDNPPLFARALLAMVLIKDDRFDEARETLAPLMEKEAKSQIEGQALWSLASELAHDSKQPALACELLESIDDLASVERSSSGFQYTAEALYAFALQQADRGADARRILLEQMVSMEIDQEQNQYNPGYGEYQYIESQAELAERFAKMGYPAEAFIAFRKAYGNPEMLQRAERWGGNVEYRKKRITDEIKKQTTPESILQIVQAAIGGAPPAPQSDEDNSEQPADPNPKETESPDVEDSDAHDSETKDSEPLSPEADQDPDAALGEQENAAAVAQFLTTPEVVSESLIDVHVTVPFAEFSGKVAEDEELRKAVSEYLSQTPLSGYNDPLSLKSLVVRQMISEAAGAEGEQQAASEAILAWVAQHDATEEPGDGLPAGEHAPPADGDASEAESPADPSASPLPDELLLAMAADRLPESTDDATIVELLQRALEAAQQSNQQTLAGGLKAQIAQRIAATDKERASEMLLSLLDDLLPAKEPAAAASPN